MIETHSLTKTYKNGFKAVDNLNLHVDEGSVFGFLGPNGAGKTTTIRMLDGLLSSTDGKVIINGMDIAKEPEKIRSIIGVVPESHGYYYWMTAREYLDYFYGIFSNGGRDEKYVSTLLKQVGLYDKQNVFIREFSRGMKQRLGIAKSLVNHPQIIFLDEPTLGLDPKGQQEIQQLLLDINQINGITVFITSHMLKDIEVLCSEIAIMKNGVLAEQGRLDELKRKYEMDNCVHIYTSDNVTAAKLIENERNIKSVTFGKDCISIFYADNITRENADALRNSIIKTLIGAGISVSQMKSDSVSIEDIFFSITQEEKGYV